MSEWVTLTLSVKIYHVKQMYFFQCETDAFSFLLWCLVKNSASIIAQIIYNCTTAPSGVKQQWSFIIIMSGGWLGSADRQTVAGIVVISKLPHSHGSRWLMPAGAGTSAVSQNTTGGLFRALGFFTAWRQGFKSTCTKRRRTQGSSTTYDLASEMVVCW